MYWLVFTDKIVCLVCPFTWAFQWVLFLVGFAYLPEHKSGLAELATECLGVSSIILQQLSQHLKPLYTLSPCAARKRIARESTSAAQLRTSPSASALASARTAIRQPRRARLRAFRSATCMAFGFDVNARSRSQLMLRNSTRSNPKHTLKTVTLPAPVARSRARACSWRALCTTLCH